MRTTIDLDPTLLDRLRHEAVTRGVSFKHLLDRLLRDGLTGKATRKTTPYRCPTYAMGEPHGYAPDKPLRKVAELDDDAIVRRYARGKAPR